MADTDHVVDRRCTTDGEHVHGPNSSYESVLQGPPATARTHIKAIAPRLTLADVHFHVTELEPPDRELPPLLQVELGTEPVGAVDFLPLPGERTLMRLFLCSDLGSVCGRDDGDQAVLQFAQASLMRLRALGFLSTETKEGSGDRRKLGYDTGSRG